MDPLKQIAHPDIRKFVERTAQKMGESAMCLNLFTDDYKRGIDSLLQFALAMMLDKPIYLLAPEGTKIPENVRLVAKGIEFYNPANMESMHEASTRLMQQATSRHFSA